MSAEILPSSSDGIETSTSKTWTPDRGEEITERKSGTNTAVESVYEQAKISAQANSYIASLQFEDDRGRGRMTTIYSSQADPSNPDVQTYGIQELLSVDVLRDIVLAPYFDSLTYYDINEVRVAYRNDETEVDAGWSDLQKAYFYHLSWGQDAYYETAFIFRRTFKASSATQLQAVMSDINTVVTLPDLSPTLRNLIASLPSGEWLKKPSQVRSMGRDGWDVSEEYQWSSKWSVVYGGTWTGA